VLDSLAFAVIVSLSFGEKSAMSQTIAQILKAFEATHHHQSMQQLAALYEEIEAQTTRFRQEFSIFCGAGCGTCCEHFNPDITALEASLVAAYLLLDEQKRPLIERLYNEGADDGPCPLYDPESPFHCTVYEVRPLICRLFGASASLDKGGKAVFRRCKYNSEETMPALISFDRPVATLQSYSYALRSLDGRDVDLLSSQVRMLVEQLQFLISLLENDDDDSPLAS